MSYFFPVFILAVGTYLIRCSFMLIGHRVKLNSYVTMALGFLSITVLPAMVSPAIFGEQGSFSIWNERVLAAFLAIIVARYSKSIILTMIAGFAMLILFKTYIFV